MKKLSLLILAILITASSFAQSPQGFNYQAVARDVSGDLIANTPIAIQFKLHEETLTGTVVYTETHALTTNVYGTFTAVVGQGTTTDVFTDLVWETKPYFLEVSIDPSNGTAYTSLGTSQLLSVPYALHAKTAESVSGINGTSAYLSKFTSANALGDSQISDDGTNVGIGASNPSERLSVHPNSDISAEIGRAHIGHMGHNNWAGFSHIGANASGNYALLQNENGLTLLNSASGQDIRIRNNNSDQAVFESDGDFGVGTMNPASKVEVVGDVRLNGDNAGVIYQNKETNKDWRLVYVDGFESNVESWIANQALSTGDLGMTRQFNNVAGLVGHFIRPNDNNHTLKKFFNLSGLSYSEVKVEFNYLFLDSWDDEVGWLAVMSGESGNPTSIWSRKHNHNDADMELNGTSYNVSSYGSGSFSDFKSKGQAQFSWSGGGFWLEFGANLDGAVSDETFGVDNIMIYVR